MSPLSGVASHLGALLMACDPDPSAHAGSDSPLYAGSAGFDPGRANCSPDGSYASQPGVACSSGADPGPGLGGGYQPAGYSGGVDPGPGLGGGYGACSGGNAGGGEATFNGLSGSPDWASGWWSAGAPASAGYLSSPK